MNFIDKITVGVFIQRGGIEMKKYKRLLLMGVSVAMLSLQGCSTPKEDSSKETKILEEKISELEEKNKELKLEIEEQGDTIVTQQQMLLDKEGIDPDRVKELEKEIEKLNDIISDQEETIINQEEKLLEQQDIIEAEEPYSFEVGEDVFHELEDNNLQVMFNQNEIKSEEDIAEYFEQMNQEVEINSEEEYYQQENTIQNKLATFVLFLNNELKIKGYTFNDLKATTQKRIVIAFEAFDQKLESIIPGYSKPILKAFSFIQEKGKEGRVILSENLNKAFGEEFIDESKESFKEGYQDMKDSYQYWKAKILKKAREEKK